MSQCCFGSPLFDQAQLQLRAREQSLRDLNALQQAQVCPRPLDTIEHSPCVGRFQRTQAERTLELRQLQEKLQLARHDLDETQRKHLIALTQTEQRAARIVVLEGELARRNSAIRELKDDMEKAVQLNIENAAKYRCVVLFDLALLSTCLDVSN